MNLKKGILINIRINNTDVNHQDHIKFQLNLDTNKLVLEAKCLMKKLNFQKAYEILNLSISQGIFHSDVFYLYGEVCRVVKRPEESEKYLLGSLKFEQHSPYVFYSLGLLYEEIEEYKYSVCFLKLFLKELESAEAYFRLASNYIKLGKDLKAAINLTKALNLDKKKEYYLLRGQVYERMGYKELAFEDRELMKILK